MITSKENWIPVRKIKLINYIFVDLQWQEYVSEILEKINNDENIDLGGHNPKKVYKTDETVDETKSKYNIQVNFFNLNINNSKLF